MIPVREYRLGHLRNHSLSLSKYFLDQSFRKICYLLLKLEALRSTLLVKEVNSALDAMVADTHTVLCYLIEIGQKETLGQRTEDKLRLKKLNVCY